MSFTAILATANARPGNIVLARIPSGAVVQAAASLLAAATLSAPAQAHLHATAHPQGASSVADTGFLRAGAHASLPASGSFVGVALRVVHPAADLAGSSVLAGLPIVRAEALASIHGSSTVVAQGIPAQEAACSIEGGSACTIDQFKIVIFSRFPPVSPVTVVVPQPYPRQTGQLPRTLTQGVVVAKLPRSTKTSGIR